MGLNPSYLFKYFLLYLVKYSLILIYKSSFDIELRDEFAFLGYDRKFQGKVGSYRGIVAQSDGIKKRDNQILII